MVWLLLGGFRLQNHCICNIFTYGEQRVEKHWIYKGFKFPSTKLVTHGATGREPLDLQWFERLHWRNHCTCNIWWTNGLKPLDLQWFGRVRPQNHCICNIWWYNGRNTLDLQWFGRATFWILHFRHEQNDNCGAASGNLPIISEQKRSSADKSPRTQRLSAFLVKNEGLRLLLDGFHSNSNGFGAISSRFVGDLW